MYFLELRLEAYLTMLKYFAPIVATFALTACGGCVCSVTGVFHTNDANPTMLVQL